MILKNNHNVYSLSCSTHWAMYNYRLSTSLIHLMFADCLVRVKTKKYPVGIWILFIYNFVYKNLVLVFDCKNKGR